MPLLELDVWVSKDGIKQSEFVVQTKEYPELLKATLIVQVDKSANFTETEIEEAVAKILGYKNDKIIKELFKDK